MCVCCLDQDPIYSGLSYLILNGKLQLFIQLMGNNRDIVVGRDNVWVVGGSKWKM